MKRTGVGPPASAAGHADMCTLRERRGQRAGEVHWMPKRPSAAPPLCLAFLETHPSSLGNPVRSRLSRELAF